MRQIIFILLILFSLSSYSQENLKKYWYYRERLCKYFVKVGPNAGESIVAERLNDLRYDKYKIGDGTIDLAWYISVLATEYALLSQNNQNTDRTLLELFYALKAYERLDLCEDKEPWNKDTAKLDGFFNREDVELYNTRGAFSLKGRNNGLTKDSVWGTKPPGQPTYIKEIDKYYSFPIKKSVAMSQDQAVHLLMGFALLVRSLPNKEIDFKDLQNNKLTVNFYTWAQQLSDLIITNIKKENWMIKDPNGDNVERGANAIGNAYGFAKAGKYITGKSYQDFLSLEPVSVLAWNFQVIPNFPNQYNTTMAITLAAIGNSWRFPCGTANNLYLAGSVWRKHYLYVPLFMYLHNAGVSKPAYNKKKIKKSIDDAPKYGTYFWGNEYVEFSCCDSIYGNPGGGWAYSNKFRSDKKGQDNGVDMANFNGLDFMLLFNLYQLIEKPYPFVIIKTVENY